jgi:hypothetical protein
VIGVDMDRPWSSPGETFGIPDRYQDRVLGGLLLNAGDNRRKPGGKIYIRPASETPWQVHERAPDPRTRGSSSTIITIASGIAGSQEAARDAAEAAARARIAARRDPKIIRPGDTIARVEGVASRLEEVNPWPWITHARRTGEAAWFEVTEEFRDEAINALPPIYFSGGFFLGEPAAHTDRGVPVHAAFTKRGRSYFAREVAIDCIEAALADLEAALAALPVHTRDDQCTVRRGVCTGCGVSHASECGACGGRGFHRDGCDESETAAIAAR